MLVSNTRMLSGCDRLYMVAEGSLSSTHKPEVTHPRRKSFNKTLPCEELTVQAFTPGFKHHRQHHQLHFTFHS